MTTIASHDRIARAWAELPYAFRATHPLPPRPMLTDEQVAAVVEDATVVVAVLRQTEMAYDDAGDPAGAQEMAEKAQTFQDVLDAISEDAR